MADITYCTNTDCPFKKCERHLHQLEKYKNTQMQVSVANFGGTCIDYLSYIYDEVVKEIVRKRDIKRGVNNG